MRFGDQTCACRVDTPRSYQKRTHHQFLGELSDNASVDGLSLSLSVAVNEQISKVILALGNDGIPN